MKKLRITVDGKPYEVTVERLDVETTPAAGGTPAPGGIPAPNAAAAAGPAPVAKPASKPAMKRGSVASPMAGVVLSVAVHEGDTVQANGVLLILEAMKMENQIIAPAESKVTAVHVVAGQAVTEGQVLVDLE